jgi:hypothetical protein
MSPSGKPRHPDAVAQQQMIQQAVNAAEGAFALSSKFNRLQSPARLVEPLIGDAVVVGEHPERIKHHVWGINRSSRKQPRLKIQEAAWPRSSARRVWRPL